MSRSITLDHFSRRKMLRGLLGGSAVTVGLPWLETFADPSKLARASVDGLFPARFGVFFWGNGNRPEAWTPIGEGPGFQLSETLQPLAGLESKLTVITGTQISVPNTIPHWSGAMGVMAGSASLGDGNDNWSPQGPTIDQAIAAEIGGETIYRSLEVSVGTDESVSFNGPYSNNPGENDPFAFFERIFGAGIAAGGTPSPTLGYRRSVLDSVMADLNALMPTLGASDKLRLDQHLTNVRELELRLERLQEDPPDLAACTTPATPNASYPEIDGRPQLSAISRAMADLMAMALACDQTRVFSFCFTMPFNNILFPGADDGHHNLTHHEPDDQPMVKDIALQCMTEYAYLLNALDAIPEGDDTLLDHCCVMATSETSEGRTHALDEMPLLYAGSACGKVVVGTHYRSFTAENYNRATLSLQRAMGVPAVSWGEDDSYTTDGLSAIEV